MKNSCYLKDAREFKISYTLIPKLFYKISMLKNLSYFSLEVRMTTDGQRVPVVHPANALLYLPYALVQKEKNQDHG